jgi:hypothetical protein
MSKFKLAGGIVMLAAIGGLAWMAHHTDTMGFLRRLHGG